MAPLSTNLDVGNLVYRYSTATDSATALSGCCSSTITTNKVVLNTADIDPLNQFTYSHSKSNVIARKVKFTAEKCIKMPIPKKIIYNGPATIVFWDDGTKTIVKRSKKEKDNKYNAFCAALAKKVYGNNSKVNRYVQSGIEEK